MGVTLSKLLKIIGLSAIPVSAAVVDATAIIVINGSCQPSCLIRSNDGPSFSLSYVSHKEGLKTFIDLRIGDRVFKNLSIYPYYINNGSPPFYKYVFPNHTIFGLVSAQSAYNSYEHYFMRRNNAFDYLGRFPTLKYDTELDRFVGLRKQMEKT